MDHDLLSPLRDDRTNAEPDWQAMEERLRAACAVTGTAPVTRYHVGGQWMAAAAGVVMAVAITFYTLPSRNVRPQPPSQPPAPAAPITQPGPDRIDVAPTPAPPPARRPRASGRPARVPAEARLNEFVPLPGAFALPDFESGRIVRMEVPVAGLPAFGIDLVPDAAPTAVEADFLIGQDGLPRAIRLASIRVQ
jgi:hypothetical protein